MSTRLPPLIPAGLVVDRIDPQADRVMIVARSSARASPCPVCRCPSSRSHSSYMRCLQDLPWQGHRVVIHVRIRRWRCVTASCPRRIFAERLPEIMPARARRTTRLRDAQLDIAIAAGGEPGSRLAHRLSMPVSGDTLLRLIRSAELEPPPVPRVVGIDDWAFRRGHRYGTIVCDLERGRVIDLLPERSAETVAAWFRARPGVLAVARDRANCYADGVTSGAPQARQVADRWHVLRNLGEVMQALVERHRRPIQAAARGVASEKPSATTVEPDVTREETRLRLRRQGRADRFARMRALHRCGLSRVQIAAKVGVSVLTVRRWLAAGAPPAHEKPPQPTNLARHDAYLDRRWREGCRNATRLWRELWDQGYRGSERSVRRWSARRRTRSGPAQGPMVRTSWPLPSRRRCARLLTEPPDRLDAEEQAFLSRLRSCAPDLVAAGEQARGLATLLRERRETTAVSETLETWLTDARGTLMADFARGLNRDRAAIEAALSEPWSTGPVEGHVNRLKTLKRAMYGRAHFDLLRRRVLMRA